MMQDEHTLHRENIPAYAIGALDAEDITALEAHLETCASCQAELAEYRALSSSLLTATPSKQPPAALRKRLQAQLPGAQKPVRPKLAWSFNRLVTGGVFIVLLVLNVLSFTQLQQIKNQQVDLANQMNNAQVALGMISYADVKVFSIQEANASGTLLLDEEHNQAVLVTRELPALAENQTYQIWLVKPDGGRDSAGIFRPADGQSYTAQTISTSIPFLNYQGIGITIEPSGGSEAPTGERVLKVDF